MNYDLYVRLGAEKYEWFTGAYLFVVRSHPLLREHMPVCFKNGGQRVDLPAEDENIIQFKT